MRWSLRVSLFVFAGSLGCVGGPVSDWPNKNSSEPESDDPREGPTSGPRGGAGSNAGQSMDAGTAAPAAPSTDLDDEGGAFDAGTSCAPDASACRASCLDAGTPTVSDPSASARLGCPAEANLSD